MSAALTSGPSHCRNQCPISAKSRPRGAPTRVQGVDWLQSVRFPQKRVGRAGLSVGLESSKRVSFEFKNLIALQL